MEQKMKMLENLQDDFDFNYKTLKSAGGKKYIADVRTKPNIDIFAVFNNQVPLRLCQFSGNWFNRNGRKQGSPTWFPKGPHE